jgi:hypothetical protein
MHPFGPVAFDELHRSSIATIEEDRTDHRLADVAEHGIAQPRPLACADRTELDVIDQPKRLRDVGAAFLAHEIGKPLRQFAFVGMREGAIQHVGYDQPEHVIAEEFEPLVAVASLELGFLQRRDMGKGGGQKRRRGKFVPDACLDRSPRDAFFAFFLCLLDRRGFAARLRLGVNSA